MAARPHVLEVQSGKFPFEYLLRHIDDEPSVLDSRFLSEVRDRIAQTVLGFALVGEVDGATHMIELLHRHGIDPWMAEGGFYHFLKPCMYFAWDATNSWPEWIPAEERTAENLQTLEKDGKSRWLERIKEPSKVDEEALEQALQLTKQAIPETLPDNNGTLAGQVSLIQQLYDRGDFGYASCPNGPFHARYSKICMWWRQGIFPYPFVQVHRSAGLAMALDLSLRLGKRDQAQDVLRRMCERFHMEEQAELMACSRTAWREVFSKPENPMLELLGIHAGKMRPAVVRAVAALDHRLSHGPRRRYKEKSIPELVRVISENTHLHCPYDALNVTIMEPRTPLEDKNGLLRPPAIEQEVEELESRLEVSLPAEYKEFLRATNGLGEVWSGQQVLQYLAPLDMVDWTVPDYLDGNELVLLKEGDPSPSGDDRLDWPMIQSLRMIKLSGGSNGPDVFLVPKSSLQKCKDYLLKTYSERTPDQQRDLERVVQETYGSMQKFEDLEWGLTVWTSWGLDIVPCEGIRDLLERVAEQALTQLRPWLSVFDPGSRRLADPSEWR